MIDEKWTLLLGTPVILFLLVLAARRVRAITARISEVREEQARNPQAPYAALAMLMDEQNMEKSKGPRRGKKTDRNG